MARTVSPVILSATMLAARVICQAQVYSQNTIPVPHQADEISLQTYCASSNNTVTLSAAWYVSTNVLAKQPRWDDLTMEVPLSAHQACGVALTNLANRFPAIKSWAVETVWLQHYCADQVVPRGQAWYYRIEFSSQDPKRHNEFDHDFDVYLIQIVLLDGTVVPPRVVKGETSTNNPPTTGNPSTSPR
jgi:hypothetical protein